jgi:peptidoglycan-associated lipoprotein
MSRHSIVCIYGPLLILAACSSTPPARSPAPTGSAVPSATAQPSSRISTASPTTSTVAIDGAILQACHISADKAFFPFDSARLEGNDLQTLHAVADCFKNGPLKGRSLKLVGRADPRGDAEYNMVLGESRAGSVASVLTNRGLSSSHISTTSRGEIDATGADEAGWSKDRRVDLLLGS